MRREEILCSLEELPDVQIFEVTDDHAVVYDEQQGKTIEFNFVESFNPEKLQEKIDLSPNLPDYLKFDKAQLAQYLTTYLDENTFITLDKLWIVVDDADYQRMAEEFGTEALLFRTEKECLGRMWFEKNLCIVDVSNIVRATNNLKEKLEEDKTFNFQAHVRRWILLTIIHELRHLMLDTNIVLPELDYPIELGSEENVQFYARELYAASNPAGVFIGD